MWAYATLGRIHGVRGRHAEAEASFKQAVDFSRRVHGEQHVTTLWLQPLLAYAAGQRRQLVRAESLAREFLAQHTEILGPDHSIVGTTMRILAMALVERGSMAEEAESLARRASEIHRKQLGPESGELVRDLVTLADAIRQLRRREESEAVAREAVAVAERVTTDADFLRFLAYRSLAMSLRATDPAAAAEHFRKAIETQRGVAIDRIAITDVHFRRAVALREIGRAAEAADCLREAFDVSKHHAETELGPAELGPEVILYYLACTERQLGNLAEANRLLRETTEICDPRRPERPIAWIDWIDLLLELHESADPSEASTHLDEIAAAVRQLEQFRKESPTAANRVSADLAAAALHIARGELNAAEPLIQSAFEGSRKAGARRAVGRAECLRADLFIRRRRFDAAERLLLTLDRAARSQTPFEIDDVLLVTRRLVKLYEAWEKPDEAARWRERIPGR